jgi:23S rRNA (cytidine1920-2'-O)/16S rRNA (cytidine1409-2'-O)-methyltransferase
LKKRLDRVLVERGFAETREKAQAMIMAGNVLIGDQPATKAGTAVAEDCDIRLKEAPHPYVSRGGLKLQGAIQNFGLNAQNLICLDVGASTGGFTHFLLLNGAQKVYALDVDVNQLDWKIRNHPKVTPVEMNARFLKLENIPEPVDLVTIDASFISLTMLIPRIPPVLKPEGRCLALVKPQFEVGREHVGKGGIVRDEKLQREAVDKVIAAGREAGLELVDSKESVITGKEGNREFFVLFRKTR